MASTTPPPNSSPTAISPASSSNSSTTTPAPFTSSTRSNSSAPPPQSPPPAVPPAPPPSPPQSPPPVNTTTPSSPPPLPTTSPPPSPPTLPPPSPRTSPPPSPPTVPPLSPPKLPTPSLPSSPPPATNSPPPPVLSPPPPSVGSPPQASPSPPVLTPPPPPAVLPSPPPPTNAPLPPTTSPAPPLAKPPENSPSPPTQTPSPPSYSPPAPPPSKSSPSNLTLSPPPPHSLPSSSSPPSIPPPTSSSNASVSELTPPSPPSSSTTEQPTARSTRPTPDIIANVASRNGGGMNTGGVVAIGIVVGLLALSLVVIAVWFTRKRKIREAQSSGMYIMSSPFDSSPKSDSLFLRPQNSDRPAGSFSGRNFMYSSEHDGVGNSRSWFSYEELAEATNGFSAHNLLGEGGFGCVYKGFLADGREVAVKQLKIGGGQGEREFRAEVEIISRVHHRHLVSLVGYCISKQQRLLVYDYVPNNTLYYHLHGEGRPVMDWATRVTVAVGAAQGIAYLHEDCHPRIIHRDIKSSNILLDNNFEARVADFGLAKLALDANTHVTTRVMGTFGYMAPEYASSGKLTEKSDVYSFGVVLLELITGRKPVDASQPVGDESLVEWARPLLTEALDNQDFKQLADPRLEKNYVESEMFRMIEAAAVCVRHLASKRPRMSQVLRALDTIDELSDLTNGMKPGQSEIYDTSQHSAQIRMFERMAFGSQDYSSECYNHSQSSWRS